VSLFIFINMLLIFTIKNVFLKNYSSSINLITLFS
jgi:hypothetical protein